MNTTQNEICIENQYKCYHCNQNFILPLDEELIYDIDDNIVGLSCDCDYIGKYWGDRFGCLDSECKKCYRCNPILYWSKRRPIPRFDRLLRELELIKKDDCKDCYRYINAINFRLIDTDFNLLIDTDEIMPK